MAIRFVDVQPGASEAPTPRHRAELVSDHGSRRDDLADPALVKLPLAKPEPKPWGRKKPLR